MERGRKTEDNVPNLAKMRVLSGLEIAIAMCNCTEKRIGS